MNAATLPARPLACPPAALLQGDALTVICWDERMELHEESGSSMHPERPDRVRAVMARLQAAELAGRCRRLPAREATGEEVGACHIPELMEAVDLLSEQSRLQGNAGLHFSSGLPSCCASFAGHGLPTPCYLAAFAWPSCTPDARREL